MKKVFISYASEDAAAAFQVMQHLRGQGFDAWFDQVELRAGDTFLRNIEDTLQRAAYFLILLSRTAMSKNWVNEELRMAVVREVNEHAPRVLALRLDESPVPLMIQHRTYIDARGRFDAALIELSEHLNSRPLAVAVPMQAVIANMVANADDELWSRFSQVLESTEGWDRTEVADALRSLRRNDLLVGTAVAWWLQQARQQSVTATAISEPTAVERVPRLLATELAPQAVRRSLARLEVEGFLQRRPARYDDESAAPSWEPTSLLRVLLKAARRSGHFTHMLPDPVPERLGAFLTYPTLAAIDGPGWYAQRLPDMLANSPEVQQPVHAVVAKRSEPARTWLFRSRDDRSPTVLPRFATVANLWPLADDTEIRARRANASESVGFAFDVFDDIGLPTG